MATRTRKDGTKTAVYTVPSLTSTDDAPLSNPLGNLSRVIFHSDLDYMAVQSTIQTGTLTLIARSGTAALTQRYNLFAHGLGYQPLILGALVGFEGADRPLLGTIFLQTGSGTNGMGTPNSEQGWFRSVQLGADATYVYLHEYFLPGPTAQTFAALTLNWRILVSTRNLDATSGNDNTVSSPYHALLTKTRVVLGKGKFDSDRRHVKKVATGGFPVIVDKSIHIAQLASPNWSIQFSFNVDSWIKGDLASPSFASTFVRMDAA